MEKIVHKLFKKFLFDKFPSIYGYKLDSKDNTLYVFVEYRKIEFDNLIFHKDYNDFNYEDFIETFEISDYEDNDYTNVNKYEFSIPSTQKDLKLINYNKNLQQDLNTYLKLCSIDILQIEIVVNYR